MRDRLPRPHMPRNSRETLMAIVLLLGTGVVAEYNFQVVEKSRDLGAATALFIDNTTHPLRKSISNGAHRVGNWADPGPAR